MSLNIGTILEAHHLIEKSPAKGGDDKRAANKITVLQRLLANYADKLPNRFVVTKTQVRFASK